MFKIRFSVKICSIWFDSKTMMWKNVDDIGIQDIFSCSSVWLIVMSNFSHIKAVSKGDDYEELQ